MTTATEPRIVLLTDADVFAGTERHMLDLAWGLKHLGARVLVACPSTAPLASKVAIDGIDVYPIAKGGLIDLRAILELRSLLVSGEVNVIHSHNGRTALSAALAVAISRRGVAVATQHFLEPSRTNRRGLTGIFSRVGHYCVSSLTTSFVAISNAVRDQMLARHEVPPNKISVVLNGIREPRALTEDEMISVRTALDIPHDASLIVCAARLEAEKDIRTLIRAMSLMYRKMPTVRCVIAGRGSQFESLEEAINAEKLGHITKLLGFREDVLALIGAADLFVLPSIAEPFGLVLLEAMALKKPIVSTAAGGPLEIVDDGVTGILVEPSQPDAMASAALSILSSSLRIETMGAAGYKRYCDKFSAIGMAQKMLEVYASALSTKTNPRRLQPLIVHDEA